MTVVALLSIFGDRSFVFLICNWWRNPGEKHEAALIWSVGFEH
jgi:hypothetical protein